MLRHQTCGKHASGLFLRRNRGHIAHDVAVFAQRAEERPVRGFERGEMKPGSGDGCHCYAIPMNLAYYLNTGMELANRMDFGDGG